METYKYFWSEENGLMYRQKHDKMIEAYSYSRICVNTKARELRARDKEKRANAAIARNPDIEEKQ